MKNFQTPATATTTDMDLWGRTLAAQLDLSSQYLRHDIG